MSNIGYRPEIDGLRAVSVIGVILFHADLGVPGGFVGVDVFFVISGFLITNIILKDIQSQSFSISRFWVRRIKRILPAASLMSAVALVAGFLMLDPFTLDELAQSAIAQSLFSANVYFWRDVGYFTEAADFKPLLHTWSLAVEEQFYFFFPLLALISCRLRPKAFVICMLLLGVCSLILSILGTEKLGSAAFFLLPTRAWELTAGALLASLQKSIRLPRMIAEGSALVALMLIFTSMFYFTWSTPFPGVAAVVPVAGATLFILANLEHNTICGRILSNRVATSVGAISYSLYLWHWLVLSFANLMIIELHLYVRCLLVAASVAMAVVSWRFIENPFRSKTLLVTPRSAFTFALTTQAFLAACGFAIWHNHGFPDRIEPRFRILADDIRWKGLEYVSQSELGVPIGRPSDPTFECDQFDFALWGDSHGMAVCNLFDTLATKHKLCGLFYSSSPPVTGLWRPERRNAQRDRVTTLQKSEHVVQDLLQRRIRNVVIVARWSAMTDGYNAAELKQAPERPPIEDMVSDNDNGILDQEHSANALRRQLEALLHRLAENEVRVWIIKQVPEADKTDVARSFYLASRFPGLNQFSPNSTTLHDHLIRQSHANRALDSVLATNVEVIDPTPFFFRNSHDLQLYSDRAYYRDDDHLTRFGAEEILKPAVEDIFRAINGRRYDGENNSSEKRTVTGL